MDRGAERRLCDLFKALFKDLVTILLNEEINTMSWPALLMEVFLFHETVSK